MFLPSEFFKDDVILRKNIPAELLTTHKCLAHITWLKAQNFSFSTDHTEVWKSKKKNCPLTSVHNYLLTVVSLILWMPCILGKWKLFLRFSLHLSVTDFQGLEIFVLVQIREKFNSYLENWNLRLRWMTTDFQKIESGWR